MFLKISKLSVAFLALTLVLFSCSKDDKVVPPEDKDNKIPVVKPKTILDSVSVQIEGGDVDFSIGYNSDGFIDKLTGTNGLELSYEYNDKKQVVETKFIKEALVKVVKFKYSNGKLTESVSVSSESEVDKVLKTFNDSKKFRKTETITYSYDAKGFLIKTLSNITVFNISKNKEVSNKDTEVVYENDPKGRVIKTFKVGDVESVRKFTYLDKKNPLSKFPKSFLVGTKVFLGDLAIEYMFDSNTVKEIPFSKVENQLEGDKLVRCLGDFYFDGTFSTCTIQYFYK